MPIKIDAVREARIVEWDEQRGFGFLQVGSGRVFLHLRDFSGRHKRTEVGDMIRFTVGVDAQGRTCAKEAAHVNDGGRFSLAALALLLGLLVLPVIAIYRSDVDWRWAFGYAVGMAVVSYVSYAMDKRRARAKEWRISEVGLHVPELMGGWPGAFVAQRRLRHKVSKVSYQAVFWMIVVAWQLAAFDSLQQWKYSKAAWEQMGKRVSQRGTG